MQYFVISTARRNRLDLLFYMPKGFLASLGMTEKEAFRNSKNLNIMDPTSQPTSNQNENKSTVDIIPNPPVVSMPPLDSPSSPAPLIPDDDLGLVKNMNTQHNGQQFKLASTEVQGPKSPLVSGKYSKFALIAAMLILIIIAGISGYYIYSKDDVSDLENSPVVVAPTNTSVVDKNTDSDKDGLPDLIEKVLGTYMTKADTDDDGFDDLQEIKSGYSPLIAGGEGKYTDEDWDNVKGKIMIEDREFYEREFGAPVVSPESPSSDVSLTPSPAASEAPLSFNCGTDTVSDIDGNKYNTVKIGDQCWLKENLKVTKNPAGEAITRYCYDNDESTCDTDGGLYDWNTTMNNSVSEGAQGICPNEWHVPKDSEWYALESGLASSLCDSVRTDLGCDFAGTKLVLNGSSGFNGIFTGYRDPDGFFGSRGDYASLWSSTIGIPISSSMAWNRYLYSYDSNVNRDASEMLYSFSVRCIKDSGIDKKLWSIYPGIITGIVVYKDENGVYPSSIEQLPYQFSKELEVKQYFNYKLLDNGKNFELCIQLTDRKYCSDESIDIKQK